MKLILLALTLVSVNTFAANDKKQMDPKMEAWAKAAAPGEEHKTIAALAGKWKYTSQWWEKADAKPHESKGTGVNKMILGGRYLQQEVNGKTMGMPFQGVATLGYDNVKKEFESTWIDNMGTGFTKATGTWDAATKTLTEKGTMADPMSPTPKDYRAVTTIVDKNNYKYEMFMAGEDGKEFKMMEMNYKRAN